MRMRNRVQKHEHTSAERKAHHVQKFAHVSRAHHADTRGQTAREQSNHWLLSNRKQIHTHVRASNARRYQTHETQCARQRLTIFMDNDTTFFPLPSLNLMASLVIVV